MLPLALDKASFRLSRGLAPPRRRRAGFTLIEAVILIAILALLIILGSFTYYSQLAKGRDGRRKADLKKIANSLEDYYNDNNCYPTQAQFTCGADFSPYLNLVPCDPLNDDPFVYYYESSCQWYRLYARLEYEQDPAIIESGCGPPGCGPSGAFNYGATSANVALQFGSGQDLGSCSALYACQVGACNVTTEGSPLEPKYCDDPCCGGVCTGPPSCP